MTATLLFLPGVLVAAFALLYLTTQLERLIALPVDRPARLLNVAEANRPARGRAVRTQERGKEGRRRLGGAVALTIAIALVLRQFSARRT